MRASDEDRERLRALVEGDEQIGHVDERIGAALAA
jgi:acyl dehydratase